MSPAVTLSFVPLPIRLEHPIVFRHRRSVCHWCTKYRRDIRRRPVDYAAIHYRLYPLLSSRPTIAGDWEQPGPMVPRGMRAFATSGSGLRQICQGRIQNHRRARCFRYTLLQLFAPSFHESHPSAASQTYHTHLTESESARLTIHSASGPAARNADRAGAIWAGQKWHLSIQRDLVFNATNCLGSRLVHKCRRQPRNAQAYTASTHNRCLSQSMAATSRVLRSAGHIWRR